MLSATRSARQITRSTKGKSTGEKNKIRSSGQKTSILIAEDNRGFAQVLCSHLNAQNDMTVTGIAGNGLEALEMILKKTPDVVLLNLIMPHLDGFGVLEKINSYSINNRPVFIIFSNIGNDRITPKAFELGADYYIVKPFDMDVLVSRIRQFREANRSALVKKRELPEGNWLVQ